MSRHTACHLPGPSSVDSRSNVLIAFISFSVRSFERPVARCRRRPDSALASGLTAPGSALPHVAGDAAGRVQCFVPGSCGCAAGLAAWALIYMQLALHRGGTSLHVLKRETIKRLY